jgi:hypothetical protein
MGAIAPASEVTESVEASKAPMGFTREIRKVAPASATGVEERDGRKSARQRGDRIGLSKALMGFTRENV